MKLKFIKSDEKSDVAAKMLKEEGNKKYKLKAGFQIWSNSAWVVLGNTYVIHL